MFANFTEIARYIGGWIAATVIDQPSALHNRDFVESLDPETLVFDPVAWQREWNVSSRRSQHYPWRLDTAAMEPFRPEATVLHYSSAE